MSYLESHKEEVSSLGLPATLVDMYRLIDKYPWFTTARVIASVEEGKSDPKLEMHLTIHPSPTPMLKYVAMSGSKKESQVTATGASHMHLIDAFLSSEHHSVRPNETTPEYDAAELSSVIDIDDEIATEELAQIYMAQGLTEQADKIFRKLKEIK